MRQSLPDDPLVTRVERRLRGPSRPATRAEILRAARRARLLFVGDVRPAAAPKRFAADVLAASRGRAALYVDAFYARDEAVLGMWRRGEIGDRELCRATRFDLELGVSFSPYRDLLRFAWQHGHAVQPTESPVRSEPGSRRRRLALAARRAAQIGVPRSPHALVLAGQAYLDPPLLPGPMRAALRAPASGAATVLFGGDAPRRLRDGAWVLPLPRAPHPRRRRVGQMRVDLGATLWGLADALCSRLHVDPYRRRVGGTYLRDLYPSVVSRSDRRLATKLLRAAGLPPAQVADCVRRVAARGSLYVPQANLVMVGRLELVAGAEEIAHFLNFALRGDAGRPVATSFYQDVWDEAIGFLGSKLLAPHRPSPSARTLLAPGRHALPADVRAFLRAHLAMERHHARLDAIPRAVAEGLARDLAFTRQAHHALGYLLGEMLYRQWRRGRFSRARLRRFFAAPALPPRGALRRYLRFARRSR